MDTTDRTFGAEFLTRDEAPVHGAAKGVAIHLGDGRWILGLDDQWCIV